MTKKQKQKLIKSIFSLAVVVISLITAAISNYYKTQNPQVAGITTTSSQIFLVTDITDGDTVKVKNDTGEFKVRFIGINAPEITSKECWAQAAKDKLTDLILDKQVTLISDSTQGDLDKYSRELRYIFVDNTNVNVELVKQGLAKEYTYNKDYIYKPQTLEAQDYAKTHQLGIWSGVCNKSGLGEG